MKRFGGLLAVAVLGLASTGCMSPQGSPDYTASGALAGAAVGGVATQSGAGAIVGALMGGIIGHGIDQEHEAQLRAQAPQTLARIDQGQPLTVEDVKSLVKAGISDDLVISQIRNSRTVYHLTTADILGLKNAGVDEKIIDFMINTPSQIPAPQVAGVIGNAPPAMPPEQIAPPPGPDYVWVGGAWAWFGDRWVWHPGYWHRPRRPYRPGSY